MSEENTIQKEPIAIIGMACVFPQAPDVKEFWRNILAGVDAISDPLPEWDADRYIESKRINTPKGGYLRDLYRFDPQEFGIMPNSIDGGEPDQFLALRVAGEALKDAGYTGGDYDHSGTGIVLGHSTYLHRGQVNHVQHHIVLDQTIELLREIFPSLNSANISSVRAYLESKLPRSNADIAPGLVPNVMTGRISNRLNLKGPNYLIDAACSSSLLAVSAAVDELRNGRSRMMLAGGVNASLPAEVSVIFTQLGALSRRGKVRPFETGSDGTLLGEGLGIIVLKRISDAIADSDRVYAIIHGIGQSSDGRGHGLLAPSVEGEALAIDRAYAMSGIDPSTIQLIEAHGTGIPLGDKTEIAALKKVLGERKGTGGSVAIGSVKSMISHCIPAAGIAGVIKTALALHHKILPPTLCASVSPELDIEGTPLYVNTETKPWITASGVPRRAGINSFGFGGINTHAILEEAPAAAKKPLTYSKWPAELCLFSAGNDEALAGALKNAASALSSNNSAEVCDIAAALAARDLNNTHRLAIVVKDREDLLKKINQALKLLRENGGERWTIRNGISYSRRPIDGKVAFMFPGEGSQYLNMFADLALCFDEVRSWFDFWRGLYSSAPGESRTDIIFPPKSELTEQRRAELEKRLNDMDVGSEAVFVGSQAMYGLLKAFGVQPDAMIGHSTGESSALVASGAIELDDMSQLADFVRGLNKVYRRVLNEGKIPTGRLLSVGALPQSVVKEHVDALNDGVVIAMDNCVNQIVLFGNERSVATLQQLLSDAGGVCIPLPFDRGYHTPQFYAVSEAFHDYYENMGLKAPRVPLYSCASVDLFPEDIQGVRRLASGQWATMVRFRETVIKMHNDGVRYFVEVGPSGNLSSFVNDILAGEEHLSAATNLRQKNSMEQFLIVLSHLYVNGKGLRTGRLFESREVKVLDLERAMQKKQQGMRLDNTMPVIHITDTDRSILQKMLALPETAGNGGHRTQIPHGDSLSESGAGDQVMADYLDLMRDFFDQQKMLLEQWGMREHAAREDANPADEQTPFLSSITEMDEQHLEGECRLSVYEDNFLRDHILSGTVSVHNPDLLGLSCVPLMVSLEIMAEACALLAGSAAVRIIENIRAFDWIALTDCEMTLNVRAESIGGGKYRARILNGSNISVSADFCFHEDWRAEGLPELAEGKTSRWGDEEIYSIGMFHGPVFQSIKRIEKWNDHGIDADLSEVSLKGFFETDEIPSLVLNPVLLDALGQLTACWIAERVGTDFNSFPSTIERIELYSHCPQNIKGLKLRARQQPLDPAATDIEAPRVWQLECLTIDGQPLLRATNLVNIYFPVPHSFYEVRRDPLNGWLGQRIRITGNEDAILWQLPHLPEKFCLQSGGIFLQTLAYALLSFDERNEWRELTTNIRHRREWLLGRACIKEAVRFWILQQTGQLLYPSDIIVLHNEQGAPYVDGEWVNILTEPPEVSLSHDRRMSLAAVTPPGHPVGVDVEHTGRIQQPDLIEGSLSQNERKLLKGFIGNVLAEKVLLTWCVKEAAAKFFGSGLQGRPEKFEVSFIDNEWNLARVDYAGNAVEVNISCEDGLIIALATGRSS